MEYDYAHTKLWHINKLTNSDGLVLLKVYRNGRLIFRKRMNDNTFVGDDHRCFNYWVRRKKLPKTIAKAIGEELVVISV